MKRDVRTWMFQAAPGLPLFEGTAAASLDNVPSSPSAYDEEWTGSAFTGWTQQGSWDSSTAINPYASFTNTGHRYSINSLRPSWLMIQPETASQAILRKAYAPTTNLLLWARLSFSARQAMTNNDASISIFLTKLSGGNFDINNRVEMSLNESDTNTVQAQADSTVASVATSAVSTSVISKFQIWEYVAILKVGTQYDFWAGTEAGSWTFLQRATNAVVFDAVGYRFVNGGTTSPGNCIMGSDFLRFRENVIALP